MGILVIFKQRNGITCDKCHKHMQILNKVELGEGRVSQIFLQAIEMGEMHSREVAVTLGESMVYHCHRSERPSK